ncbi:hypothetical protein LP419_04490 [Massilia sp. H-1]|nr:hypothetical protein LP419_04490 [Massilia sp. H-1]
MPRSRWSPTCVITSISWSTCSADRRSISHANTAAFLPEASRYTRDLASSMALPDGPSDSTLGAS